MLRHIKKGRKSKKTIIEKNWLKLLYTSNRFWTIHEARCSACRRWSVRSICSSTLLLSTICMVSLRRCPKKNQLSQHFVLTLTASHHSRPICIGIVQVSLLHNCWERKFSGILLFLLRSFNVNIIESISSILECVVFLNNQNWPIKQWMEQKKSQISYRIDVFCNIVSIYECHESYEMQRHPVYRIDCYRCLKRLKEQQKQWTSQFYF